MAAQENSSEQQLNRLVWFSSSSLFNSVLERIISDPPEEHVRKAIIGGTTITNLWFTDGIDALAEKNNNKTRRPS